MIPISKYLSYYFLILFFTLHGCSSSPPSNDEAIKMLEDNIFQTARSKDYTGTMIEILDWKEENDNWIAKVKVTAQWNKRHDYLLNVDGFGKLFHAGSVKYGELYSKESFVTFSKFEKGWTPHLIND